MKKPHQNLRILIVDDNASMRRIINRFLRQGGFDTTVSAANGKEALEKLKSVSIDLIISDLNMPVMNGLELLKEVKFNCTTKKIPFIMVTVEAIQRTMNKAVSLNVDSYIVKPFEAHQLIDEIRRVTFKQDLL